MKRLLLYGQPFFCWLFFFVLQVTTTVAPAGRFLADRFRSFVYFLNPSELMLAVDGTVVSTGGGGCVPPPPPPPVGGGGGAAAVVKPTSAPFVTNPRASVATSR